MKSQDKPETTPTHSNKPPQQEFEKLFLMDVRKNHENPLSSPAWQYLIHKFGPTISIKNLKSLATIISDELQIPLHREMYRRKETIIYWLNENFDQIKPFIDKNIIIQDQHGQIINGDYSKINI